MKSPIAALGDPATLFRFNRESITANKTLTSADAPHQSLAPDAARDVTLPAEELGLIFYIVNRAAGAFALTLKNDAATTLASIAQNAAAIAYCDGTGWHVFLCSAATAQT